MPLHVTIKINDQLIENLHIARIAGGTGSEEVNTYLAVLGERPIGLSVWQDRGVEFQHRYGDGALVCVRKALESIEQSQ